MLYAPENELGVVFLFARLAKKFRVRIEQIRSAFPDCIAYQKIGGSEKRIRIEFEFRSRSFKTHGHNAKECDWIVCWEHDWPDVPEHLEVKELRREYGQGFNVWIQPVGGGYKVRISEIEASPSWSVPSQACAGDLLLFYHNSPEKCIKDLFTVSSPVRHERAGWKRGMDYAAAIRRVCCLAAPVFLEDLQQHRILKTAGFVRSKMRSRPKVTEYWTYLHELIVRRNPSLRKQLDKYAPARLP